jgi:hypothetical protein
MAAGSEGGSRKQRDWLYLVVDKLVIGLLLVALTLTANWVLDRKREKDEAAQERGRARQALVAEFARVRTEKIAVLLQTQARTDHALATLQARLLDWRAAEKRADDASAAAMTSSVIKDVLTGRKQVANLNKALKAQARAFQAEARAREVAVTKSNLVDATLAASSSAVADEEQALTTSSFWLGATLRDVLARHLRLSRDAAEKIHRLLIDCRTAGVPGTLLAAATALDKRQNPHRPCLLPHRDVDPALEAVRQARDIDIDDIINAFSVGE